MACEGGLLYQTVHHTILLVSSSGCGANPNWLLLASDFLEQHRQAGISTQRSAQARYPPPCKPHLHH